MRAVRLYLKVLVWTGLPVGAVAGLAAGDLVSGALVALSATAILGTIVLLRHPVVGGDQSVRVAADPAVVRRRVLEAFRALPARIVTAEDVDRVVARTGMSWQSWGERITVDLHAAAGFTDVRVRSSPRLKSTPYNYGGKDRRNVEYLVNALDRETPRRPG